MSDDERIIYSFLQVAFLVFGVVFATLTVCNCVSVTSGLFTDEDYKLKMGTMCVVSGMQWTIVSGQYVCLKDLPVAAVTTPSK